MKSYVQLRKRRLKYPLRQRRWVGALLGVAALTLGVYFAVPAAAAPSTWLAVSAGGYHTCGIKTGNTLWCWGLNNYGQLGLSNTTNKNVPTQVGTATNWASVTTGRYHTCAATTAGAPRGRAAAGRSRPAAPP